MILLVHILSAFFLSTAVIAQCSRKKRKDPSDEGEAKWIKPSSSQKSEFDSKNEMESVKHELSKTPVAPRGQGVSAPRTPVAGTPRAPAVPAALQKKDQNPIDPLQSVAKPATNSAIRRKLKEDEDKARAAEKKDPSSKKSAKKIKKSSKSGKKNVQDMSSKMKKSLECQVPDQVVGETKASGVKTPEKEKEKKTGTPEKEKVESKEAGQQPNNEMGKLEEKVVEKKETSKEKGKSPEKPANRRDVDKVTEDPPSESLIPDEKPEKTEKSEKPKAAAGAPAPANPEACLIM